MGLEAFREIQKKAAQKILLVDAFKESLKLVAGIDLAFMNNEAIASCIVVDFLSQKIVETQILKTALNFPYIPTFLAFREGPAIIEVLNSVRTNPDVFLINAQGIAHPMKCGCASQIGVEVGKPTIGVTVNRLYGEYKAEPKEEGEATPLIIDNEQVGWVLKSRAGSKPIFISPGHLIGLNSSLTIVKTCLRGHKLPEPLYLAHLYANQEKLRLRKSEPVSQ